MISWMTTRTSLSPLWGDICRASCNSKLPVGAANFFSTFVGRHSFILNLSTSTSGGMLNFLLEYCRQFVNHCIPLLSSFLGGPWNKYMPLIWRGCPVSACLIVDGCWFDGDGLRSWSIVMLRAWHVGHPWTSFKSYWECWRWKVHLHSVPMIWRTSLELTTARLPSFWSLIYHQPSSHCDPNLSVASSIKLSHSSKQPGHWNKGSHETQRKSWDVRSIWSNSMYTIPTSHKTQPFHSCWPPSS